MSLLLTATVAATISFGWLSSKSNLTVLLRCNGNLSGTLSIYEFMPEGTQDSAHTYQVRSACEGGSVEFTGYEYRKSLHVEFKRGDGKVVKIFTEYGTDIQSSNGDDFYTVLKLMDTPPYVANDSI